MAQVADSLVTQGEPLHSAFDNAPIGMAFSDGEGHFVRVNPAAIRMVGFVPSAHRHGTFEIPEQTIRRTDGSALDQADQPWSRVLRDRVGVQGEEIGMLRPDGGLVWASVSARPLADGGVVVFWQDISELRRVEETLQLKEAAVESSLYAVAIADLDGRLRYVNDAFVKMWGLESKLAPLGRFGTEFWVDPESAAMWAKKVKDGPIPHGEMVARRPDGSVFDAEFTTSIVRDRSGRPLGILGTFIDATERHLAEQALRRSEERFTLAFNVMPDAVYLFELATGHFLEVNPGFERLSGYSRAEALGRNMGDLGMWCHTEDRDRFRQQLAAEGHVRGFLCETRRRDGTVCWAESSSDPIVLDGRPCLLSTTRDVTDRIRAENALRESEARFRTMFDTHDAIMFLVDPETGAILDANQAAELFYGYPPKALAHMSARELNTTDFKEILTAMKRVAKGAQPAVQRTHRLASGELRDMEIYSSSIDMGGRRVLFAILHDITARGQLEAQVRQAQKMESLGSLAGGVAHDMNNILGAILGITSLLRTDDLEDQHSHDYETIMQACLRGRTMVRGLLDFTRQELVDLQPIDLNLLAQEQARLVRSNLPPDVRLDLHLAPGLRRIRGDSSTLGRAVMNLIMNAIDALGDSGRIAVHTRNADLDTVELVVEDDGPGMSKEVLDKALDPFFTTKPLGKGTGLGLAIVYGTMKAHRGQFELRSQPGQGARACLRFSASLDAPAAMGRAHATPTPTNVATLDVLLVDDDPLIQGAVSAMLRRLGHRVTAALTGAEALHLLESSATCSLVILDLNMPVLDGPSTLPRLRALRPSLPVLLATGRADEAAQDLARSYSAVTILPKPFTFGELRQHLDGIAR